MMTDLAREATLCCSQFDGFSRDRETRGDVPASFDGFAERGAWVEGDAIARYALERNR
jgi:hypothetical protein